MTGLDRVLRNSGLAFLAAAGALVWAAPALADDGAIQAKIERRLHKAGLADTSDVQVEVRDGVEAAVIAGEAAEVGVDHPLRRVRADAQLAPEQELEPASAGNGGREGRNDRNGSRRVEVSGRGLSQIPRPRRPVDRSEQSRPKDFQGGPGHNRKAGGLYACQLG